MSETDSFIIPTKLKYTLPSSSTITVNNTDNTNNVINYSNSKKMKPFIVRDNADKTAEFGQITNDIQNLIADTQKDKYTAVVYKDEAFTTIIDTPEKYSNEIVKYYVKKQPMKQLKYVTNLSLL